MAFKFSIVAVCFQQALAGCPQGMMTIHSEGGGVSCVPSPTYNRSLLSPRSTGKADINACVHNFCESSAVKANLVKACKAGKYKNCDALTFHKTHITNPKDQTQHTMYFEGKVVYDNRGAKKSGVKSRSRFNQEFENGNTKEPDYTDYKKTVSRSAQYSWTLSASSTLSATVSTSVKMGIPDIADVNIGASFTTSATFGGSTGHQSSTTQTWEIDQHIVEEPHSCTRACIMESTGEANVPFTLHGTFAGHAKKYIPTAGEHDGFMCCYLRPGGAHDCGSDVWGTAAPKSGWTASASLASAVKYAKCSDFGTNGDDASYTKGGTFHADMDFDVDVKTKKGPYRKCPSVSVCDSMLTNSSNAEFVV